MWNVVFSKMSTRPESLKHYLRTKYGEKLQKSVNTYGKELNRAARFANHHHFNLRCNKVGLVPLSLRINSPVNTDRAESAAKRVSRMFLQARIKTLWRVMNAATKGAEQLEEDIKVLVLINSLEYTLCLFL